MSDNDIKTIMLIYLKNSITLICFTILAIVFQKWWIVLFSILFWTYYETKSEVDNE